MKLDLRKVENMEFDGIDFADYPDFVDAFLVAADYDGRELSEKEIDFINDEHYDFVNEEVYSSLF